MRLRGDRKATLFDWVHDREVRLWHIQRPFPNARLNEYEIKPGST